MSEIITMAKKAADAWRNTDTYHQAAQIIDMLVEELERKPTLTPLNEWVSVEERLPPLRENVLVCAYWHEHWGVYMGWNSGHGWTVSCGIGQRSDVQVSYWMPLPAPPYRRPPEGAEIQPSKQARAGALCGIQII